jgi:hypothetical protein
MFLKEKIGEETMSEKQEQLNQLRKRIEEDMSMPLRNGATQLVFGAGQSHLIFGTGSTSCITTSQLSKLCCAKALYKPPENLDAIALAVSLF